MKGGISMTAIISKWGNSQGIRFPKHILDAANIKVDDPVNVKVQNNQIVITRACQKRKTIEERFADFTGDCPNFEMDWGEPKGEEVW